MKYLLSIIFCLIFSAKAIGQHDRNLNYDTLIALILEDIPLENFKNEPTFLRVFRARGYCIINEHVKNQEYQTKNSAIRTHFLSAENLARLQGKIKTALIPYFDGQGMESLFLFHGNPIFKRYRGSMPKFETITQGEIQYYNTKQAIGYFPYKDKPLKINVQKGSLWDYVDQTNHIKLEFHQSEADKVFVEGTINHKKVALNYQFVYGVWQQVPQFRASDISHYNHKGQLFIKHNDITFEFEKNINLYEASIDSETDITPVNRKNFKPETLISIDSIAVSNFSDLWDIKFVSLNDGDKYEFFQFNSDLFALVHYYKYEGIWENGDITFYAYNTIFLKNQKKIYSLFGDDYGMIIPENNGFRILLGNMENNYYGIENFSSKNTQKQHHNYNTETLAYIANKLNMERYYKIKNEAGEKHLYSYRGNDKFYKAYDSILVNNFIVGVKDGIYDIYNQAFQKLPLENVRAFHLIETSSMEASNYIPHSAQILDKNKLKTIYLSSHKEKNTNLFAGISYMEMYYSDVHLKLIKKNKYFHIRDLETSMYSEHSIPIAATAIDSIYFFGNKKQEVRFSDFPLRYGYNFNKIIHLKTKKGTHYLYHINYLENSNPLFINTVLEEVKMYGNTIRFKENNKYGYYGIHNKGRFIKLEPFQGFFARFELPNGQKGWLDRNGKEYLDIP